jgi:glutathione S-transferase
VIYHLALPEVWAAAQRTGSYEQSTRDATLAEVGFVHCSERDQVARTCERFYADLPEVVLLTVDEAGLDVRREPADGQLFPHVYGPIPVGHVLVAQPFAPATPPPL